MSTGSSKRVFTHLGGTERSEPIEIPPGWGTTPRTPIRRRVEDRRERREADVVEVEAQPLTWVVRMVGLPEALPTSTGVTFLDDSLEGVKIENPDDPTKVNLAGRKALLASDVQVFRGTAVPSFTLHIVPVTPEPGAEHRQKHITAADFSPAEGNPGTMEAKVQWSAMDVVASGVRLTPREIPGTEVVEEPSSSRAGTVMVLVGGIALAWAAWKYWPSPRSNPHCCAACARGAPCRKRARR